jgi:hypothetical protein
LLNGKTKQHWKHQKWFDGDLNPNLEKGAGSCNSNLTYTQNPIKKQSKQFTKTFDK